MTKQELQYMINEMVEEEIQKTKYLENYSFNDNDYDILKEAIVTAFLEENDIIYDTEYVSEGANIDSLKAFRSGKKKFKNAVKKIKHYKKHMEKSKAKKAIKEAEVALNEMEKAIRNTESDIGSVVLGAMIKGTKVCCELIVTLSMAAFGLLAGMYDGPEAPFILGATAHIGVIIKTLIKTIKTLSIFAKELSNTENNNIDKFNVYKHSLLASVKDMRNILKIIEKKVDKMEDWS